MPTDRHTLSCALALATALATTAFGGVDTSVKVTVSLRPAVIGGQSFYVANRAPLAPTPLVKLPIGAVKPRGWLRHQLMLMAHGMVGHLPEVSHWCRDDSAWMTGDGAGWEELPYWLKGYTDLGYVLGDEKIVADAERWLDAIVSHQQDDGWFGPLPNRDGNDVWPNMVILYAMQARYEATGDERVIRFMDRYFRWELAKPEDTLLPGSWQQIRGGDNLWSVYWLYNRTAEPYLLELAERIHRRTADWTHGLPTPHGVNICQSFRGPAEFYMQSKDPFDLDATNRVYNQVWGTYGRVPGAMFAADENSREGHTGPQYAAETCSIVEFMNSCETLLIVAGDPKWADRCEEAALNSFPAAYTPDFKGIHYLTAPNLVLCDAGGAHEFQNQGFQVAYSPGEAYRCCQHNVAQGWPYYTEHLWMATQGNGLAAVLYAPCEVSAKVGDGTEIRIAEQTDYPFGDTVTLRLSCDKPTAFPLTLRIPGWCENAWVAVNGATVEADCVAASYVALEREWRDGDTVVLTVPMEIAVRSWPEQRGAVSVRRGPLWYSLAIDEEWTRCGGTDAWPDWEVRPSSPWNYGLVLGSGVKEEVAGELAALQPFTAEGTPIKLVAHGRRIPEWRLFNNTCGALGPSPVYTEQTEEEITLIPMGCARLRVSVFPVVGGPEAGSWPDAARQELPAGLSYAPGKTGDGLVNLVLDKTVSVFPWASYSFNPDPPDRAIDGIIGWESQPSNRWTCWQSPNAEDWLELRLDRAVPIRAVGLFVFADGAGCWPPRSVKVEYQVGDRWVEVSNPAMDPPEAVGGKENRISFDEVTTDRVRITFTHLSKPENHYSAVTEVALWGPPPPRGVGNARARTL